MRKFVRVLMLDQRGATAIEYGLIVGLISVAMAGSFMALGNEVGSYYDSVANDYLAAAH